jgi:hypothetical protein
MFAASESAGGKARGRGGLGMAPKGWRPIHEAVIIALLGFLIGIIAAATLYYFMLWDSSHDGPPLPATLVHLQSPASWPYFIAKLPMVTLSAHWMGESFP